MEIKNEKNLSWTEAREILKKREQERELVYEQKNALEHLNKFCRLSKKKYEKITEKLRGMGKLKEKDINLIMNFLPGTKDELRTLFSKERAVLSEEDKSKIIKIVKENR